MLNLDQANANLNLHQYWDYHFRDPDTKASKEEYQEELNRLFQQAVKRQLVSDVELCTYLSGGMDSASITALAAQQILLSRHCPYHH